MEMPEFLQNAVNLVKEKPYVAAIAAAGGIGLVIMLRRGNSQAQTDGPAEGVARTVGTGDLNNPLSDISPSYPPVIVNQPSMPPPNEQTNSGTSLVSLIRDGKTIKVTGGPAGVCPPGYVSATDKNGTVRCTLANDANKKPRQATSFVPSMGQSPYGNRKAS